MKFSDRFIDAIPWFIATFLVAGIVHIVSVLLIPEVAPHNAFARLAAAAKAPDAPNGGALVLSHVETGEGVIPFEDPSLAEGVCMFDLSKGLLRVQANVDGEDFLALSFHRRNGRLFHAMTDRSAIKGKIDIVVGDAKQIEALESEDDEEAPPQQLRLTAPSTDGFVLIRSLAKRPSDYGRAEQKIRTIACESVAAPQD
ncbi:MAG: hypothetical protein HYS06_05200 [Methylocystis sp.]|nr:hypothetical protein [Methylocystis sp.]MBI3275605.1 hypothetical protein [Methylocystis sp.]